MDKYAHNKPREFLLEILAASVTNCSMKWTKQYTSPAHVLTLCHWLSAEKKHQ